jgi:hypothetical protein
MGHNIAQLDIILYPNLNWKTQLMKLYEHNSFQQET